MPPVSLDRSGLITQWKARSWGSVTATPVTSAVSPAAVMNRVRNPTA